MTQQKSSIVRWVFSYALKTLFQSDKHRMAISLNMSVDDIERAISNEGARIGAPSFEKLAVYCAKNGYSVDDILGHYMEEGS